MLHTCPSVTIEVSLQYESMRLISVSSVIPPLTANPCVRMKNDNSHATVLRSHTHQIVDVSMRLAMIYNRHTRSVDRSSDQCKICAH